MSVFRTARVLLSPFFSLEKRIELARSQLGDLENISIVGFSNLLVDFVLENNASVIVRGLRAVSDFEYELQMALLNKRLDESIETIRSRAKGRNNIRVNAYRQQQRDNDLESVAKHFDVHDVTQQEQEPTPLIEQDGEHAMVDINNNKGSERDKFKLENWKNNV